MYEVQERAQMTRQRDKVVMGDIDRDSSVSQFLEEPKHRQTGLVDEKEESVYHGSLITFRPHKLSWEREHKI